MFDQNFYPTPKWVIRKMIEPYRKQLQDGCAVLEPEAGKGDILDFISEAYSSRDNKYYCFEYNQELTMILQEKGYRFLDYDFLEYHGHRKFDLIVMNPPFDNGDKHLLKAWEIMENGHIVCLLNAATLSNPYTKTRKLVVDLIERFGSTEEMGRCFGDAERPCNVDVVMVRLEKKTKTTRFDFLEELDRKEEVTNIEINEEVMGNALMLNDTIKELVRCFNIAGVSFIDEIRSRKKTLFYGKAFGESGVRSVERCIETAVKEEGYGDGNALYNRFMDELTALAWHKVFTDSKIKDVLTSEIKGRFEEHQRASGAMEFTEKNVHKFFEMLIINRRQILESCILSVFDKMTAYHYKNKVHVEGWKTNDAWKVNKKVILPDFVYFDDQHSYSNFKFSVSSGKSDLLDDADKVMCYLTGKRFNEIRSIRETLRDYFRELGECRRRRDYENKCESEFFRLEFFKKGTLHLYFKDEQLWQEFNMRVAEGKNWLPDNYKTAEAA